MVRDKNGIERRVKVTTPRILAHELGHLTGTRDDGPGRMNNINSYENPIMKPIDGLERLDYTSSEDDGVTCDSKCP